jgi:hypothetical protein
MSKMKQILLQAVAVLVTILVFPSCNKSDSELDKGPVKTGGYVKIDDNAKVNLDKATIYNNGNSWFCIFYDSDMYTVNSLLPEKDIVAKDDARGAVIFNWVIGDGFDPIVKGQYPDTKHIHFDSSYYEDPVQYDRYWHFLIGDEEYPAEFNMQFTADRLKISFDGQYYKYDYIDNENEWIGNARFEFDGQYELINLPCNGYYSEDRSFHEIKYCGIQKVNETDSSIMYALLLSPDALSGKLTELPERFIAVTYEFPKPDSDYQFLQSYISSCRLSGSEINADVRSGYFPIPVQDIKEVFVDVRTYDDSDEIILDVCYRCKPVNMSLSDDVLRECFSDAYPYTGN